MPIYKSWSCILAALLFCAPLAEVNAQSVAIPDGADFAVRLRLDAFRDTRLGEQLLEAVKAMAAEELDGEKNPDAAIEDIEKALGFNPFDEIHSVTVIGSNFDDPLDGVQVVVGVGNTTGNLEGLLLALPGYQSTKRDGVLIHSVELDDERVYGAIYEGRSRRKQILIATTTDDVQSMWDAIDSSRSGSPSDADREWDEDGDTLLSLRLNRLPKHADLEGPPAAIARLLKHVSLSVRERRDAFQVRLHLKTDDEKHAEQLQQLAQGLVALVGLLEDADEGDEELKIIAELLEGLEATRDGTSVEMSLDVPEELVIEFLREEADLPLSR